MNTDRYFLLGESDQSRVLGLLTLVPVRQVVALLVVLAFTSDIGQFHEVLGGHDFRVWQGVLILTSLLLFHAGKLYVPVFLTPVVGLLVLHLLVSLAVSGTIFPISLVQLIAFSIGSILCYSLVKFLGMDKLIDVYLLSSVIIAYSILLEEFIYVFFSDVLAPFYMISNFGGEMGPFVRAHGLLREPSQAGILLAPSVYLCLARKKKFLLFLIVIAVVFTGSTLAFLGSFVAFIVYLTGKSSGVWKGGVILVGLLLVGTGFIPAVQERVVAVSSSAEVILVQEQDLKSFQELGSSIATLTMNLSVAIHAMQDTYLFGVGFGAFGKAFVRYSPVVTNIEDVEGFFYNQEGGGSLLIRIITELGLLGLCVVGIGLWRYIKVWRAGRSLVMGKGFADVEAYVQGLSLSLIILVTYFIRKDQYFDFSFLIALWASYYCARAIAKAARSPTFS